VAVGEDELVGEFDHRGQDALTGFLVFAV